MITNEYLGHTLWSLHLGDQQVLAKELVLVNFIEIRKEVPRGSTLDLFGALIACLSLSIDNYFKNVC